MIAYDKEKGIFQLDTDHTTYLMGLSADGFLGHIYYGKRLLHPAGTSSLHLHEVPSPAVLSREKMTFLNTFPFEYPTGGAGDLRQACLTVTDEEGNNACELTFDRAQIVDGKPALEGLPASFGEAQDVSTLKITLKDHVLDLSVTLLYSVFPREDVITRSVLVTNEAGQERTLTRVLSACLDMDNDPEGTSLLTLDGAWARERHIEVRKIGHGRTDAASVAGESSHQENPFVGILKGDASQDHGEVYGLTFVYSGNFLGSCELSQYDTLRVVMGIHPDGFAWTLKSGETFTAPEVVMTYSDAGLTEMTHHFHDFFRAHLIRSRYLHEDRPVLINNWEGTYFDFDRDRLLLLAKEAKANGIEMFVMDDGWFGVRNDDDRSLGDWYVNETKLPGGVKALSEAIHDIGMKFGIWIEPEMISPDSDLYRAHPDYAMQIPGRIPALARDQLVLDLTRKEVRDAVMSQIEASFKGAQIDYVKWDMNRQLAGIGSTLYGDGRQGEILHRYVLGLYEMQQRLLDDFPDLLFENCSSGGARFDAGMLYYSPQIWTSDDTDAIERLRIQEGTALVYPLSTMGAHVSRCPNEQVGRNTPFETRANVALAGTFGYELDLSRHVTPEEKALIPEQVKRYHKYHHLIAEGDYYRLVSWNDRTPYDAWECTAKDGSEALVTLVQVLGRPNTHSHAIRLKGLDPSATYRLEEAVGATGREYAKDQPVSTRENRIEPRCGELKKEYFGDELMNIGILVPDLGDGQSRLYHFVKE